jgi:hypothetical protein
MSLPSSTHTATVLGRIPTVTFDVEQDDLLVRALPAHLDARR